MNRNCSACNIRIDENIYLKHRTICKKFHNENKRKNNINTKNENQIDTTPQQPNIDKINNNNDPTFENHACVVIGPRNVAKTYYILKVLEKKVTMTYQYNDPITKSISKLQKKQRI